MNRPPRKALTAMFAVIVAIETAALIEQTLAQDVPFGVLGLQVVTSSTFQILAPLSPLLVLLILYSWVGRVLTKIVSKRRARYALIQRFRFLSQISQSLPVSWEGTGVPLLQRPLAILSISMASAFLLALLPYRPDINPAGIPVGTDTPEYIQWVNQMLQKPVPQALGYAFSQASNGSRPLSLIFPYIMSALLGVSGDVSVKFYPLLLAPLLVISSFLFVLLGFGDKRTAGLVAMMTTFSFQFTVGMWAGYYSNWLALAESYLFLGIILRFSYSGSKVTFLGIVFSSLSLLFTHPWTWDLMILLAAIFMVERSLRTHDLRLMKTIILVAIISLAVDILRSFVLSTVAGSGSGLEFAVSSAGFAQSLMLWPDVVATFVQYYNGLLADAVILGLSLMTVWRTWDSNAPFSRLLIWWVALASLPFPFLTSIWQSRIVYLLPTPVLASAGVIGIGKLGCGNTQKILIILLLVLYSANYSLSAILQI